MSYKSLLSLRAALLLSWGFILLVVLVYLGPQRITDAYGGLTPESIRDFVASFGLLSAIIYIFLYVLRSFFFLPVTPFTIAGGFLYGAGLGLLVTLLGRTIISSTITFYLSRYVLRDFIKARIKGKYSGWDARLEKSGIMSIAIMRMVPMLPFDAVCYIAGASSISFRKYLIGTIIGDLPGVFVLTLLGSSLTEPGSPLFYISLFIAALVAVASWLYIRMYAKKEAKKV